ncbi:hypothetical protein [Nonomuraea sp. NPDC049480]|uniref:hypothetical protein n=1 Tax=Nonomuraea sp. NPDC049480 TaxID=3364353 RepID=UPI0037931D61
MMHVREPDWAYGARSLVKVLAVTAALYLAFSAVDRVLWLFIDSDDERMARLYGTVARIANPDKRLPHVAVVEFAHSMPAERLVALNRRHRICGGADVSYIYSPSYYDDSSEPASLNAVVWNRGMTEDDIQADLAYQCETEPVAALAEFRRWVGLLDEGDDLGAFELDDTWLAGAADEGVAHGLVVDRWKLADLRELLDDPEVRTVHLADVAFGLGEIG